MSSLLKAPMPRHWVANAPLQAPFAHVGLSAALGRQAPLKALGAFHRNPSLLNAPLGCQCAINGANAGVRRRGPRHLGPPLGANGPLYVSASVIWADWAHGRPYESWVIITIWARGRKMCPRLSPFCLSARTLPICFSGCLSLVSACLSIPHPHMIDVSTLPRGSTHVFCIHCCVHPCA